MPRKQTRTQFHEPSLVPLADMLTNTVGVMVFILIFTVLTAGGAVIAKRLPMEHATKKQDFTVICWGNRVYPMPDDLIHRFLKPLGQPEQSRSGFDEFAKKFRVQVVEEQQLKLTGEAEVIETPAYVRLDRTIVCTPKEDKGESIADLKHPDCLFCNSLKQCDPNKQFVMFVVCQDSIDAFKAARDVAVGMQLSTGWSPHDPDLPIRFSLGGGRKPIPQ